MRKNISLIIISIFSFFLFNDVFALEYTTVKSESELKTAITNGENIKLGDNFEVDEQISISAKNITMDLNGYTITGIDNQVSSNFILFNISNKSTFKIIDSKDGGKITLTASTNRYWENMSVILQPHNSTLIIDDGEFRHLGGTDMTYVINVNTNSTGDATATINGGVLYAPYTAVRLYMSHSGKAYLNVFGGSISGGTSAIWAQAPENREGQLGSINIEGGEVSVVNTARGTNSTVETVVSGGTVDSIKSEEKELKITGGTITGNLTILDSSSSPVSSDEIVTGGTFINEPTNFLSSKIDVKAVIEKNGKTIYSYGEESIKEEIKTTTDGDVIEVTGDIELKDVEVGVIVKALSNSEVKVNGSTACENGLTVEATMEVNVESLDKTQNVQTPKVGIYSAKNAKSVLESTIKNTTDSTLKDLINKNHTNIEIDIKDINSTISNNEKKSFEKEYSNYEITNYYDINVLVKNALNKSVLTSIKELDNNIKLVILIPEDLRNDDVSIKRTYYVLRKHDNEIKKLDTKLSIDGSYLTFETKEFSTYALAYLDEENDVDTPQTFDKGISNSIFYVTLSLMVLGICSIKIRKELIKRK